MSRNSIWNYQYNRIVFYYDPITFDQKHRENIYPESDIEKHLLSVIDRMASIAPNALVDIMKRKGGTNYSALQRAEQEEDYLFGVCIEEQDLEIDAEELGKFPFNNAATNVHIVESSEEVENKKQAADIITRLRTSLCASISRES